MDKNPATVAACLTVHGHLTESEHETLLRHWSKLDHRLRSFHEGEVILDLYIKDREKRSQHVVLEATIDHWPVLIAQEDTADIDHALNGVRDHMVRLIGDSLDRSRGRRR